jgi:uncharacterized damage-inducible protein DinB
MFRKIADFELAWTGHVDATMKMFSAVTDDSLLQAVADNHRTIGRIAWHIVTTIPEMMIHAGLEVESVSKDAPLPRKISEIQEAYKNVTAELLGKIKSEWDDEKLSTVVDFYGEKWELGRALYILVIHEVHHRGQLTVLMRQAGLEVPGVYGPSKEEWAGYGMVAPEI